MYFPKLSNCSIYNFELDFGHKICYAYFEINILLKKRNNLHIILPEEVAYPLSNMKFTSEMKVKVLLSTTFMKFYRF